MDQTDLESRVQVVLNRIDRAQAILAANVNELKALVPVTFATLPDSRLDNLFGSPARIRSTLARSPIVDVNAMTITWNGHKRSGRHGEKRYYHTSRGKRCPRTGDVYNRSINATALEKEMLRVLREVLLNKPDLMDALRRAAEHHARQQIPADDRPQIEKMLMKKQRQIAAALENLTGDATMDRPIELKMAEYRAEAARLKTALRSAPKLQEPVDIDAAVEHLARQLADFASNLDGDDYGIIAEMFELLVHRTDGDLLTKEVEVVLALPDWLGQEIATTGMMGLDAVFACRTQNETHRENAIILGQFHCNAQAARPVCYSCRRLKRAA